MSKTLGNRSAPITGAGSPADIGFATAEIFAREGARLADSPSGLVAAAAGLFALGLAFLPPTAWNQYVHAPIFILVGGALPEADRMVVGKGTNH